MSDGIGCVLLAGLTCPFQIERIRLDVSASAELSCHMLRCASQTLLPLSNLSNLLTGRDRSKEDAMVTVAWRRIS